MLYGNPLRPPRGTSCLHYLPSVCVRQSLREKPGHSCGPRGYAGKGLYGRGGELGSLSRGPQGLTRFFHPGLGDSMQGLPARRAVALGLSGSIPRQSRRGRITGCFCSVCRLKAPSPDLQASVILTSLLISVFLLSTSLKIMQRAPDWSESLKAEIPTPSCPRKAC